MNSTIEMPCATGRTGGHMAMSKKLGALIDAEITVTCTHNEIIVGYQNWSYWPIVYLFSIDRLHQIQLAHSEYSIN